MALVVLQVKELFQKPQALLLSGSLGSGKTSFVRYLLEIDKKLAKKFSSLVLSPTFTIQNTYQTFVFGHVQHFDLYRIKNDEDLESTGFWDVFSQKKDLLIIEWADRLNMRNLPPDWNYLQLFFSFGEKKRTRHIKIK